MASAAVQLTGVVGPMSLRVTVMTPLLPVVSAPRLLQPVAVAWSKVKPKPSRVLPIA